MIDNRTGLNFTDETIDLALKDVYVTIKSEGYNKAGSGGAFQGKSLANTRQDHRFLQWKNGDAFLEYNENLAQTYTMLDATTDCGWSQHLQWETDYQYQITEGQWTSLVNPGSMTDENGDAHVMFSAWEDFIGYTVTVQCGYTDECGVHYLESIKIKVVDEE